MSRFGSLLLILCALFAASGCEDDPHDKDFLKDGGVEGRGAGTDGRGGGASGSSSSTVSDTGAGAR